MSKYGSLGTPLEELGALALGTNTLTQSGVELLELLGRAECGDALGNGLSMSRRYLSSLHRSVSF